MAGTLQANGGDLLVNSISGNGVPFTKSLLTLTYADADITLTSGQYQNPTINCIGTNTAQRKLVLPLVAGAEWYVANNGTGQNIQAIGSTGTGIIVPTTDGCFLWSDGVNIYRKTPNATITT
jgi:hypothetical protein